MSAQKRLSQLSVAAVALLVVALPCFAQTETVTNDNDKTTAVSVTDTNSAVAVNREKATRESRIEAKSMTNADTKTKAPKFSASTFVKAATEAPATMSKTTFEPVAVPDSLERKQSGSITFLPSVGSKLPR